MLPVVQAHVIGREAYDHDGIENRRQQVLKYEAAFQPKHVTVAHDRAIDLFAQMEAVDDDVPTGTKSLHGLTNVVDHWVIQRYTTMDRMRTHSWGQIFDQRGLA